jgi:hypothetical protein
MIGVTGNAGASIALRNSILKVIPTTFWKPIYNACRKVIAGDVKTFASRRDAMLHEFSVMGVTVEKICSALGVKGKADITGDHMVQLAGFLTALRDGDTTIEDAFPESGGLGAPQPAQRRSQQPPQTSTQTSTPAASQAPAATATDGSAAPPSAEARGSSGTGETPAPAPIGVIVDVVEKDGAAFVVLSTGFRAGTRDASMIASAKSLRASGRRVELTTKAPKDPKYAPSIVELSPVQDEAGQ